MSSPVPINTTLGALLLGGFLAAVLSGAVIVQVFLYMKLFPQDCARIKAIVAAVWTLDTAHSLLVYTSIWIYLISNYGEKDEIDTIPIPLALTVITTAILTFIVHCFFAHRIHKLSREEWRITALILVLAFFRLCCATVTTIEMIHKKTFKAFKAEFRWVFTLGLAMSTLVDILITGFLTYSLYTLQNAKRGSRSLDRIIGAVVLYTFETNLLTSAATIVSMICWLAMPNNLIFMGLHFVICKLYANSLLATLNTRKTLQHQRQRSADFPPGFPRFSSIPRRTTGKCSTRNEPCGATKLEITVEKTVEFETDDRPLADHSHPYQKRVSVMEPLSRPAER